MNGTRDDRIEDEAAGDFGRMAPDSFAVWLTDNTQSHGQWLSVVRFGLKTLLDAQPLLIEIICREAQREADRSNLGSHVAADHIGGIMAELSLKLVTT